VATRVVADSPGEPKYRLVLADSHGALGKNFGFRDGPEAEEHLARAIELATQLVAEYPGARRYRHHLALFYRYRAELRRPAGDPADYRRFIEAIAPLLADYPAVAQHR